jgi:uncharacterized membrane protein YeaQ/YmgE (transglycosylase-associated protein family)
MTGLTYFLLIGLAAGWLAGRIMTGHSFGLVGNLVVGVVGAILCGFLFQLAGLLTIGLLGNLIAATVGQSCCCSCCRSLADGSRHWRSISYFLRFCCPGFCKIHKNEWFFRA